MNLPDKSTTCCFTGHRFFSAEPQHFVLNKLNNTISKLCNKGITTFLTGGALGFDTLAAKAVLELRKTNSSISLIVIIPCRDQASKWTTADKREYENILASADEVICLNDKYCTGCMHQRNRLLVKLSSVCVAYYIGKSGGTAYTIGLARENGLQIINLAHSANVIE